MKRLKNKDGGGEGRSEGRNMKTGRENKKKDGEGRRSKRRRNRRV